VTRPLPEGFAQLKLGLMRTVPLTSSPPASWTASLTALEGSLFLTRDTNVTAFTSLKYLKRVDDIKLFNFG